MTERSEVWELLALPPPPMGAVTSREIYFCFLKHGCPAFPPGTNLGPGLTRAPRVTLDLKAAGAAGRPMNSNSGVFITHYPTLKMNKMCGGSRAGAFMDLKK